MKKIMALILLIVAFNLTAGEVSDGEISQLRQELASSNYTDLFQRLTMENADKIWKDGERLTVLIAFIESPDENPLLQFMAAELIYAYDVPISPELYPRLAYVYTVALSKMNAFSSVYYPHCPMAANPWGMLYEMDDPGWVGIHLIEYGEVSIPYLVALLNNSNPVLYEGSHEATIGNSYHYRIKDFAHYYLVKILEKPVVYFSENEDRDRAIWELVREILLEPGRIDGIRILFPDDGSLVRETDPAMPYLEVRFLMGETDVYRRNLFDRRLQVRNETFEEVYIEREQVLYDLLMD